jgi:cyclopropane-fatty-acyl-phospholipid synthase
MFPGGELDDPGMSGANLPCHGFEVHGVKSWRERYARACRLWHDRLSTRIPEAEVEIDGVKTPPWLAYLAGCALAFPSNTAGMFQTLAWKRLRRAAELQPTWEDLHEDWPGEMHSRIPTLHHFHLIGDGCAEEELFISRSCIDSPKHADL